MRILILQRFKHSVPRTTGRLLVFLVMSHENQRAPFVPPTPSTSPESTLREESLEHFELAVVLLKDGECVCAFADNAREDMTCKRAYNACIERCISVNRGDYMDICVQKEVEYRNEYMHISY